MTGGPVRAVGRSGHFNLNQRGARLAQRPGQRPGQRAVPRGRVAGALGRAALALGDGHEVKAGQLGAWIEYLREPSPIGAFTRSPGSASATPTAAGMRQPRPPLSIVKKPPLRLMG